MDIRKSVGKMTTTNNRLGNAKLADRDQAMNVGKRLFEYYDKEKLNRIDMYEIKAMIKDIYTSIGIDFEPSNEDIKGMKSILDIDEDGTVSMNDMQQLMAKYLSK